MRGWRKRQTRGRRKRQRKRKGVKERFASEEWTLGAVLGEEDALHKSFAGPHRHSH